MNFEWDEHKSKTNLQKHGISFSTIINVFDYPMVVTIDDRNDYGEPRYIGLGVLTDIVVVVVFTRRHRSIRIISSRKANKRERKVYYEKIKEGGN